MRLSEPTGTVTSSERVHNEGFAPLEQFLKSLEGEVVAIIPNVTPIPATFVDFLLIVEKVG